MTSETTDGTASQALPPTPEHAPQFNQVRRRPKLKALVAALGGPNFARILLGVVTALLLLLAWFGNNPNLIDSGSPSEWRSQLSSAAIKNEVNNGETKGAPQQSVVNGWYANDLAEVQASQNSYLARSSDRNGALTAAVGFGIAGELIIRGIERSARRRKAMG
jgi:hypothetical protein